MRTSSPICELHSPRYTLPARRESSHQKMISTKGFVDLGMLPTAVGGEGQKLWERKGGLAQPMPYHKHAAQQAT